MVSAIAVLSGPDRSSRLIRSVHRVIGTFVTIGDAALLLSLSANGVVAVPVIAALQVLAELFVGRNDAVALLFITPWRCSSVSSGRLRDEMACPC